MVLFVGALFTIVGILIILQIYVVVNNAKRTFTKKEYPPDIVRRGEVAMAAVKSGRIKKHLLINDAKKFKSDVARKAYVDFVDNSTLFDVIDHFNGKRYNG